MVERILYIIFTLVMMIIYLILNYLRIRTNKENKQQIDIINKLLEFYDEIFEPSYPINQAKIEALAFKVNEYCKSMNYKNYEALVSSWISRLNYVHRGEVNGREHNSD